jgi:transcriptional regulator GlxA family with amidase domain
MEPQSGNTLLAVDDVRNGDVIGLLTSGLVTSSNFLYCQDEMERFQVATSLLRLVGTAFDLDTETADKCAEQAIVFFTAKTLERRRRATGLAPWQVAKVVTYVEAHLTDKFSIDEMARLTGLSTSHFCRGFKVHFAESPHTYLMRRRIERAKDLMLGTSEPLCQIALSSGFCDQGHLSRLFRRFVGETPSAWLRRRQKLSP